LSIFNDLQRVFRASGTPELGAHGSAITSSADGDAAIQRSVGRSTTSGSPPPGSSTRGSLAMTSGDVALENFDSRTARAWTGCRRGWNGGLELILIKGSIERVHSYGKKLLCFLVK
jgi:hypothetical protein